MANKLEKIIAGTLIAASTLGGAAFGASANKDSYKPAVLWGIVGLWASSFGAVCILENRESDRRYKAYCLANPPKKSSAPSAPILEPRERNYDKENDEGYCGRSSYGAMTGTGGL